MNLQRPFILFASVLLLVAASSGCDRGRRRTDGGVVRIDSGPPPRDSGPLPDGEIPPRDSGPGTCVVGAFGSGVGPATFSGTTSGANLLTPSCSSGSTAPERVHDWTAPSSGVFTIDTSGSGYDTVLYVYSGACPGAEIGCDDDSAGSLHSLVTIEATAGQHFYIVVDGYSANMGTYVVNITAGAG